MKIGAPYEPGASELYRQPQPDGIITRALGFLRNLVAPKQRLDGIDIYHGNVITDETLIPTFQIAAHKLTEGDRYIDPACGDRLAMFARRGIEIVVVYHWMRSDSTVAAQWANFNGQLGRLGLATLGQLKPGVILMLDQERTYTSPTTTIPDPPFSMVTEWNQTVDRTYGQRRMLYSAPWVPGFDAWRAQNPDEPFWLANYGPTGPSAAASYNATCLQFTSSAVVPGFRNPIDGNTILRMDVLRTIAGLNQPPAPTPTPAEEEDTMDIVTNSETFLTSAPDVAKFVVKSDGSLRHITYTEWVARGSLPGNPLTNAQILELGAS